MNFMNLFTTSFDDVINYDDFLKILYKFGDMPIVQPGGSVVQMHQDYTPHHNDHQQDGENDALSKLREGLVQRFKPKDREVIDRIRQAVRGQPLEEVLRKFSRDNKDQISEDEFLIGVSKLNANLYTGDLKDFVSVLKGMGQGVNGQNASNKVSIAEAMQLIG